MRNYLKKAIPQGFLFNLSFTGQQYLLMFLSTSFQSIGLQDFLKRFLPKLSATRTLRLCRSLCLRHLREVVCFHLRVLPLSVCLLYVVGLIYHSIFRKNHKKAPKVRDTSEAEGGVRYNERT